jgi:hypothetical protein
MSRYAFAIAPVLVAALLMGRGVAQEHTDQPVSGTHEASCIVRISSDRHLLPINDDLIQSLLVSTPVYREAVREILGTEGAHEDGVVIRFKLLQQWVSEEATIVGEVHVAIGSEWPRVAEEFLADVCKRLERALARVGEADEARLQEGLAQLDAQLEQVNGRFEKLDEVRRKLWEQAGRADLSRERIEDLIRQLEEDKADFELKLAGASAREQALLQQIARIGHKAEEAAQESGVVAELRKVVELREKRLEQAQRRFDEGVVSAQEVGELQEQLALARAELAKHEEQVGERVGGGTLGGLNQQLAELSIEAAELEAALKHVRERLGEIQAKGLLELADRYERDFEIPLELAKDTFRALSKERQSLADGLRTARPPEVLVIGR